MLLTSLIIEQSRAAYLRSRRLSGVEEAHVLSRCPAAAAFGCSPRLRPISWTSLPLRLRQLQATAYFSEHLSKREDELRKCWTLCSREVPLVSTVGLPVLMSHRMEHQDRRERGLQSHSPRAATRAMGRAHRRENPAPSSFAQRHSQYPSRLAMEGLLECTRSSCHPLLR